MSAKANNAPYQGVFEGMDFPPYEYEHYPLWMWKGPNGSLGKKLVNDEEEEAAAKAEGFVLPPGVGKPVVVTEADLSAKDSEIEELKKALEDARAALAAKAEPAKPTAKA